MNMDGKVACRSITNVAKTISMSIASFLKGFDVVV
jgi:hypothetical protein